MKIKSFQCPKSIRNYEKKILGTLDNSFVPSTQGTSVLYFRLLGFLVCFCLFKTVGLKLEIWGDLMKMVFCGYLEDLRNSL